jgi:DNA modification methylase
MSHENTSIQQKLFDIAPQGLSDQATRRAEKIQKEKYPRYQKLFKQLYASSSESILSNFELEFNKQHDDRNYQNELFSSKERTDEEIWSHLESYGWREKPFDKQHWGNWLHSLSPYQGRITPSFTHWLVKIFSQKEDVVLDPFCGVGTIPLEADLLGRSSIGIDLNSYAALISKAKIDRTDAVEHVSYLKSIGDFDSSQVDLETIDEWIRDYFHDDTLREILWLTEQFQNEGKEFLLACLMGILHGNRPGYLSVYTGCIIPMKPRGIDHPKYRPDKDAKEYRAVLPRLLAKIIRMYKSGFPKKSNSKIFNADSRNLPLESQTVDVVISSPPYYDTLDYVSVNRVRLYILGHSTDDQKELKNELIQDKPNYQIEMLKVGVELRRVLKPNHFIVFILGDVHKTNYSINTAKDVSNLFCKYLGFEQIAILNDSIPKNKTASRTKREKFDRVLVLKNANPELNFDIDNAEPIEMTTYTNSEEYLNEPPRSRMLMVTLDFKKFEDDEELQKIIEKVKAGINVKQAAKDGSWLEWTFQYLVGPTGTSFQKMIEDGAQIDNIKAELNFIRKQLEIFDFHLFFPEGATTQDDISIGTKLKPDKLPSLFEHFLNSYRIESEFGERINMQEFVSENLFNLVEKENYYRYVSNKTCVKGTPKNSGDGFVFDPETGEIHEKESKSTISGGVRNTFSENQIQNDFVYISISQEALHTFLTQTVETDIAIDIIELSDEIKPELQKRVENKKAGDGASRPEFPSVEDVIKHKKWIKKQHRFVWSNGNFNPST